jgi:hypothetical protein
VHKIIPNVAAPAILSIDLAKPSTQRGDSSQINASSSTLKKERDVKTAKFLTTSDSQSSDLFAHLNQDESSGIMQHLSNF